MTLWTAFKALPVGAGRAAAIVSLATLAVTPVPVQQQTFRTGTTLVPVDVRVIARDGTPVTDLRAEDFTVTENGVPQPIAHFAATAFTGGVARNDAVPHRTAVGDQSIVAPTRRIFLIVLGHGHLQVPSKGIDALQDFVRAKLLPQDLVAVLGYNRATPFTMNRDGIAELLERYRKESDRIETQLAEWLDGLRAEYGDPASAPPDTQKAIDRIFDPLAAERVNDLTLPNASRMARDIGDVTDALRTRAQIAEQPTTSTHGGLATTPSILGSIKAQDMVFAESVDLSIDDYARLMTQSQQDLSKLYAGIQYLRQLDGEKHLIYVTPFGMTLPRLEDTHSLAAFANDGRVTIDTIQVGGTSGGWSVADTEHLALDTGGVSSIYSYAIQGTNRLAQTTSFQYVLGYYPSDSTLDGRFRRIEVKVKRPGVDVLYRHGYYARAASAPLDGARLLAYNRVVAALNTSRNQVEIAVRARADYKKKTGAAGAHVLVHITVGPGGLTFNETSGTRTGSIDVAVFCGDYDERLIGSTWHTVDLQLTGDAYKSFTTHGLTIDEDVPVTTLAQYFKVIVYDPASNRVGSMGTRIQ